MKKKLLAIFICLVMVAGLLPTVAFAAENYDLYVNGEQFTSEKLSIACGEGTASYDPNTKTLTLNNATITNGGKSDESPKYGIRVVGDTDLTIKLSGTNSITLDNGGGIFADGSRIITILSVTVSLQSMQNGMHSIRLMATSAYPKVQSLI